MIMLLDTSSLDTDYFTNSEDRLGYSEYSQYKSTSVDTTFESFNSCVPPMSEVFLGNDEIVYSTATPLTERTICNSFLNNNYNVRKPSQNRFREIKALQTHYLHLLRNLCKHSNDLSIQILGDTDASLKRSMNELNEISHYCSILIK